MILCIFIFRDRLPLQPVDNEEGYTSNCDLLRDNPNLSPLWGYIYTINCFGEYGDEAKKLHVLHFLLIFLIYSWCFDILTTNSEIIGGRFRKGAKHANSRTRSFSIYFDFARKWTEIWARYTTYEPSRCSIVKFFIIFLLLKYWLLY